MTDVFVSHRSADTRAAERLAEELRARGHNVWLDLWEIRLGDSIIAKISEGLTRCSHVILCYSDIGSMSPWMTREWMSALARQLQGSGVSVLPVKLTGGSPPAILADIKYADLTADWDGGIEALCAALA
jgi:hypothetical protein